MRSLLAATSFLTRLPAGRLIAFDATDVARSAAWFPLIGAALGAAIGFFGALLKGYLPEGVIAVLCNPGHVQTGIGGKQAPMTPAESVARMRAVISRLTLADAGKFLHYDGTELRL